MGKPISKRVEDEYLVLDGAMGTMLQQKGLTPDDLPEEWNITHAQVVSEIHLEYLRAGAQIITTNTFGGSTLKLGMKGLANLMEEVNRRGVENAKAALNAFYEGEEQDDRYIAGSLGPTGKMVGMDVTNEEVIDSFKAQGEVLSDAGVDLVIIETMMNLEEASCALKALIDVMDVPIFASMVFTKTKKGEYRTLFGNKPTECARRLTDEGATAVGANCGLIDHYVEVIREMRNVTDVPLVMYPNAGIPKLKGGITVFEQTPEYMIEFLDKSIEAGATIIGGCCGTTPKYISMIAKRIKGKKRSSV